MKRFVFIIVVLLLTGCKQQELLTGLSQRQANEVVAVLMQHNIVSSKTDAGKSTYKVSVQQSDFAAAVDLLKIYSLPSRERIEISQMFPADSLVSSPRAEKARLYSAIEQRLEQSLQALSGIITARVHVSYDMDSSESIGDIKPTHISAIAICDDTANIENQIIDIKRFLVNSFANVEYENISVLVTPVKKIETRASVAASDFNKIFYLEMAGLFIAAGILVFGALYRLGHLGNKKIPSPKND
ncbi:EscJ/YscJ/HrcJ family type III secretion inner membrane ring protein [Escherichia coli]|uniref:EscJ/YscJ/HrcJ family type III secretion inner membrane ring protein n=1 Tax=Escherichia coli TaxID=562 RepID=UPI001803764F|nr:EscJ/YscJ/HrcJ family type III secretion inner membrane ring protein [Escherichia coli]EFE6858361.1 EscJ/YscJ/HrcJ family type III secretion inner membrane ring protein [Escherichia coli]EFO0740930.1 EscJ/YscJ/HrcJ family type III secretion inner membrane ring protein [Escherichia coli]EGH0606647.1 EscJ/YscJ/HrcJ family type III secretion inner membrane ring protein [Escherichia coli]EHB0476312.1 EscJ/YscJ/HrcJ family type III secretion inner membrane ring protein [Escherichia coli]